MQLYMSWYIIFRLNRYFLDIVLYFFKYSCTNMFHKRSLYTFYIKMDMDGCLNLAPARFVWYGWTPIEPCWHCFAKQCDVYRGAVFSSEPIKALLKLRLFCIDFNMNTINQIGVRMFVGIIRCHLVLFPENICWHQSPPRLMSLSYTARTAAPSQSQRNTLQLPRSVMRNLK